MKKYGSIYFSIYFCSLTILAVNENHNKPFGTGSSVDIDEHNGFLNPLHFVQNYVLKSKPILMKQAAKDFPAFKKWNDEYFLNLDLSKYSKKTIVVEKQKKEDRKAESSLIDFKKFIQSYNKSEIYMVDKLPAFLNEDIITPWSLQCTFFDNNIYQVLMWFSSGGTCSVVHTDDMENVNCLISGEKTFVIVDPVKHKNKIPLNPNGAYSDIDVDRVDFFKYEQMSSVDYIIAKMIAGDCLYLPKLWIHQVRSFNRNIAINIWFRFPTTINELDMENNCNKYPDNQKRFYNRKVIGLDDVIYHKSHVNDMLSNFQNRTVESMFQEILKLYEDAEKQIMDKSSSHIKSVLKDIVDEMDLNTNGVIDESEINNSNKESFDRISNYIKYLKTFLVTLTISNEETTSATDGKSRDIHTHSEL